MLRSLIKRYQADKVIMPTYSMYKPPSAITFTCYKAKFLESERYIKIQRKGCIFTDIIPCTFSEEQKKHVLQPQNKASFRLSDIHMVQIMQLAQNESSKQIANFKYDEFSDGMKRNMQISKLDGLW